MTGLIIRSADGKTDAPGGKIENPQTGSEIILAVNFEAKNNISDLSVFISKREANATLNGGVAEYIRQFDTPREIIRFGQERKLLIAYAGGERIEVAPDKSAKDKFRAKAGNERGMLVRDANGKVTRVTIITGAGREITGRKIN